MLDDAYLDGLDAKPLDEVDAMHKDCSEVETEVSYVRRLAQARIDILSAELDRRASGGSVEDLVARLPSILADEHPRSDPAHSRLPLQLAPSMAITWQRGLEHLISDSTLLNLPLLGIDELQDTRDELGKLEREMSSRRRSLHGVIDDLEADLAARRHADQT
jgi:hypothetical protein